MWEYSEKVLDHFHHPRNVGTIENPDGVGQVGALACGDALKLMFKLGPDGRIADVKFQTFGCASAIASSSALTEMIKGMTLEEASKVTNADIAKYLDGLPEQKMHCSVMGMEALEAAIANYRTGDTAVRELKDDPLVCTCFNVHESEIVEAVRINKLTTVEQVTNYTKAGGACGRCKGAIRAILDRELGKAPAPASAPAAAAPFAELSPAIVSSGFSSLPSSSSVSPNAPASSPCSFPEQLPFSAASSSSKCRTFLLAIRSIAAA